MKYFTLSANLVLVLLLLPFASAIDNEYLEECQAQWLDFLKTYEKTYVSFSEHLARREIFCKNLKFINEKNVELNQEDAYGINHMSDWTRGELDALIMKSHHPIGSSVESVDVSQLSKYITLKDDVPESIDYRDDPRIVGPVKHQGKCGSCWAFSTTGLMEANEHKWDPSIKKVTPLSDQQLVDCVGGNGCMGYHNIDALDYIRRVGGLQREKDYPYRSANKTRQRPCKFNESMIHPPTRKFGAFIRLDGAGEEVLQDLVASYGPVLVNAMFPDDIYHLKNGIYNNVTCSDDLNQNHAVLVVGYGTSAQGEDYWIVRNSWGVDWAEGGYGKMSRNKNNQCEIASWPHIIV